MKRYYLFLASLLIVLVSACQAPIELSTPATDSHSGARVSFVLPVQPGTNITAALNAACTPNTTVIIPEGTYTTDPLSITASNLTITSNGAGATLVSSVTAVMSSPAIVTLGSLTNLTFQNINFASAQKSTNNTFLGLVTSQNETINGLTFDHCKFTAPNCNANGLKFIMDAGGKMSNLTVKNCVFRDIGRIGAELTVFRADQSDKSVGFQNVVFLNNEFHNLGLVTGDKDIYHDNIPDHWGMAISLAGVGNTVQLSTNVVDNPYNIGLEVTRGCTDVEISGNTFYNLTRTTSEYKVDVRLSSTDPPQWENRSLLIMAVNGDRAATTSTNARIFNNKTTLNCTTGEVSMRTLKGSLISSNNFQLGGNSGWWELDSCENNTFTKNSVNTSGLYGFYIYGTSTGNVFNDTYVDVSRSTRLNAAVLFDFPRATKNQFCGLTTSLPANSTQDFIQSNGATGNTKTCMSNISGSYDPVTQSWTTTGLLVGASDYVIHIRDSNKAYLGDNAALTNMTSGNQWSIQSKKLGQPLPTGNYYLYAYSPTSNVGVWSATTINVPSTSNTSTSNISGSYDLTTQSWTTTGLLVGASDYVIHIRDSNKAYLGDNAALTNMTSGNQWSIQSKKLGQPLPTGNYYLYAYSPTSNVGVWSATTINVPPSTSSTSNISGSYDPATQSWTTTGLLVGANNYVIHIRDSNKAYLGDNAALTNMTSGNQWSIQGKKLAKLLPAGNYYLYAYSPTSGAGVWSATTINVP